MSIIQRIRSDTAGRSRVAGNGLLVNALSNGIVRPEALGGDIAKLASTSSRSAAGLVSGDITKGLPLQGALSDQIRQRLVNQMDGVLSTSTPAFPLPTEPARVTGGPPSAWTAAPLWGGLTVERYRQIFIESAMTAHSWKNLWFVSITEQRPSKEAPQGVPALNLLALDASFAPVTMPGEMIPVGGSNVDNLMATERVELRLTTLDDERGSVQRWFLAKADQVARMDGSFGLPADYLVTVTVMHMTPTGEGDQRSRMTHRWLMRPSNIDTELSRRAPELIELQLSFTQFDTFMQAG